MIPMRWSIRYKFLLVTTGLLFFCVSVYLIMATHVFKTDKTELVFDLNRSFVHGLANDLRSLMSSSHDKLRVLTYLLNSSSRQDQRLADELLKNSPEIVLVAKSQTLTQIESVIFKSHEFFETYGVRDDVFIENIKMTSAGKIKSLQTSGDSFWRIVESSTQVPLLGIAKRVTVEGGPGEIPEQFGLLLIVKAETLSKSIQQAQRFSVSILDAEGKSLLNSKELDISNAHQAVTTGSQFQSADMAIKNNSDIGEVLFREANASGATSGVINFTKGNKKYLGAFSKDGSGKWSVISYMSNEEAFAVVDQFMFRSGLVALMVLNLAFIAAILFSRSITQPLLHLMNGMNQVRNGDLGAEIKIKSKDEIAELASSFNGMIRDLKSSRNALEEVNRDLELKVRERTQQLEKQNQAVKSAQETLIKTTRLAAVGEMAGRAAHEVLNPLTTLLARAEKMAEKLNVQLTQDSTGAHTISEIPSSEVRFFKELIQQWQSDYQSGGFDRLLQVWKQASSVSEGENLWEEDIKNLKELARRFEQILISQKDDLLFVLSEAQRISRIVQSMRGLSAVRSEKFQFDLRLLLEDVANIMRDMASQYDIQIQILFPHELGPVEVLLDRDEFIQAMTNLVRNSIQSIQSRRDLGFNELGYIIFEVTQTQKTWNLQVRDNGEGIRPEYHARLFESQFSTKTAQEGTGLGLNISRRFIRAIGGDIKLAWSRLNEETCFLITIPRDVQLERQAA